MLMRMAAVVGFLLFSISSVNAQEKTKGDSQEESKAEKKKENDNLESEDKGKSSKPKALSDEDKTKILTALRKAQAVIRSDSEQSIKLIDEVLADFPTFRAALFLKANAQHFQAYRLIDEENKTKEGYAVFLKCAATMRKLAKHYPKLNPLESQFIGTVYYNEACALSLSGKKKEAVKSLEDAVKAGFKDLSQIEKDEDLKAVRDSPEFKN